MARAVSATGNMSQLINAAAATQGDTANIIASQGRPTGVRTMAHSAHQEQGTKQHRVDVDEDQRRVDLLLVRQPGALQSAQDPGDQTLQLEKPAGEHRILQNRIVTGVEVGRMALQQAATRVQAARCRSSTGT
mgnify:CR=1 FL=1